jgi:hypothetical protein
MGSFGKSSLNGKEGPRKERQGLIINARKGKIEKFGQGDQGG